MTISALVDAGQPWRRTALGDNLVYTDWKKENFYRAISEALGDTKKGKIGIEEDHVTLQSRQKLGKMLDVQSFQDVGEMTMEMRMVKSLEEQNLYRKTARIADLGGFAVRDVIKEGVPEYQIALYGTEAMTREIARSFPDQEIRDIWIWLQSGINTDGAHNPLTTRKLQNGDILSLNCFPMVQGKF